MADAEEPIRSGDNAPGSAQTSLPRVIVAEDVKRMHPATAGVSHSSASALASYLGGRLHGLLSTPGVHGLFRDEFGKNLDGRPIPDRYYRLMVDGINLRYVHSDELIRDADDPSAG